MKKETEKVYKLVKKYGGVLTDDRHFMDDVDKLLETAHNSNYAKCPCCGEPWNPEEHDSCQCGAFIKKRL